MMLFPIKNLPPTILAWYDQHHRILPWRHPPHAPGVPNSYYVWLSEIMLQQTTVPTVLPYFQRFVSKWPTAKALAAASLDEILHAWQGLGYYARARNLHKCAQHIVEHFAGDLPQDYRSLLTLPGIGPYTAAAISSIAFDDPQPVMDGNIERIMARLFAVNTPLPQAKKELYEKVRTLTPPVRAGDYAQALMDLASLICTPSTPKCEQCPLLSFCKAGQNGNATDYPRRPAKKEKPTRYGIVYWVERSDGNVLLRQRPANGLLGGLMELPSSPWTPFEQLIKEEKNPQKQMTQAVTDKLSGFQLTQEIPQALLEIFPIPHSLFAAAPFLLPDFVSHTFTHFHLRLYIAYGAPAPNISLEGTWCHPKDFHTQALPTVMKKVINYRLAFSKKSPAYAGTKVL